MVKKGFLVVSEDHGSNAYHKKILKERGYLALWEDLDEAIKDPSRAGHYDLALLFLPPPVGGAIQRVGGLVRALKDTNPEAPVWGVTGEAEWRANEDFERIISSRGSRPYQIAELIGERLKQN
ncbi:MAG: hypothetical protein ABH864_03430 [archaeon]